MNVGRAEALALVEEQFARWAAEGNAVYASSWQMREVLAGWLVAHAAGVDDEVVTIERRRAAAE